MIEFLIVTIMTLVLGAVVYYAAKRTAELDENDKSTAL